MDGIELLEEMRRGGFTIKVSMTKKGWNVSATHPRYKHTDKKDQPFKMQWARKDLIVAVRLMHKSCMHAHREASF